MANHSIAGEWRGFYDYHHRPDTGSGFNAFFTETSGRIEGTIVDDFAPGKATLTGSFVFPSVLFTKIYLKTGHQEVERVGDGVSIVRTFLRPVEYEGSMSEDGKSMSGKWFISSYDGVTAGTWTAHRLREEEEKKEVAEKVELVRQGPLDDNLL